MSVWPLVAHLATAVLLAAAIVGVSYLLGERHRERETDEPFESGMPVIGEGRARYGAHFYLVAVFFVIFDLEAVFLFAWAVAARDLGWLGYVEIAIFVGVLLVALAYLWRAGALDWNVPDRSGRTGRTDR